MQGKDASKGNVDRLNEIGLFVVVFSRTSTHQNNLRLLLRN